MVISYTEPFSRAWQRMVNALFKPFDLRKWFMVGFTAFLAGLLDSPGGKGGSSHGGDHVDFGEIVDAPRYAWDWLTTHPMIFSAIIFGVIVILAIVIIMTWLSSRGKFMFLDNVTRDRAEVAEPWNKFKHLADSLFYWRLVFGMICFLFLSLFIIYFFMRAADIYQNSYTGDFPWLFIIRYALLLVLMLIIIGFISLLLDSFIVPIMYQNNMPVMDAWRKFLPLFQSNVFHFLIYALFIFLIYILVIICIFIFGFMTCCIGFILLVLPYINSVTLLPVSYTLRAYSVEFLAQFGPEYFQIEPLE